MQLDITLTNNFGSILQEITHTHTHTHTHTPLSSRRGRFPQTNPLSSHKTICLVGAGINGALIGWRMVRWSRDCPGGTPTMPSSFLLQKENKFTFDYITCAHCRICYTRLCMYLSAYTSHGHSCTCVRLCEDANLNHEPLCSVSVFFNFFFSFCSSAELFFHSG